MIKLLTKTVNIYPSKTRRIRAVRSLRHVVSPTFNLELSMPQILSLIKEGHKLEEVVNGTVIVLNKDNYDIEGQFILDNIEREKNKNSKSDNNSDQKVNELSATISNLQNTINTNKNEYDKKIQELNLKLSEKDNKINELNGKLDESAKTITNLQKQISDSNTNKEQPQK